MSDDLTLIIGGRMLSGWTSIRVTRGIERCPADFEVMMTELYPDEVGAFVIFPGDYCQVLLGADLVITGYVDRFSPAFTNGSHSIQVSGRSKCADLIDCAAEWPNGQISGSSVLEIARKLAEPYGVSTKGGASYALTVSSDAVDPGPIIPQFSLSLGETAFAIIDRICRYTAFLAYDNPDGNLFLTRVGTVAAASGFEQGVNVQAASITYAMDEQYSEMLGYVLAVDTFHDISDTGNLQIIVSDGDVTRHRRKIIVAESGDSGFEVLKKRAYWEIVRRSGRSRQLKVTTDGWRDSAGKLYTPNTRIPVNFPALKITPVSWLISEVTYRRDGQSGTTCDLVIMPPEAFMPQPSLLYRVYSDVPGVSQ
jgi:prophage tail gpP-like protein